MRPACRNEHGLCSLHVGKNMHRHEADQSLDVSAVLGKVQTMQCVANFASHNKLIAKRNAGLSSIYQLA